MTTRRGPSLARLIAAERRITAADGSGIVERWRWGREALDDPRYTTEAGHLRHGIAETLIHEARTRGRHLSEREIRYRLQAARAYATPAEIGSAAADFGSWRDLCDAGFPLAAGGTEDHPQLALIDASGEVESGAVVDESGDPVDQLMLDLPGLEGKVDLQVGARRIPVARITVGELAAHVGEAQGRAVRHLVAVQRLQGTCRRLTAAVDGDQTARVVDAAARLQALGGDSSPPPLPPAA